MNERQLGITVIALTAVLSLSLAAATFGSSIDSATRGASSGVYTENVTLADDPAPEINVSQIPFLKVFYQYFEPSNESTAPNSPVADQSNRSGLLPIIFGFVTIVSLITIGGGIWLRWLRGGSDTRPDWDLFIDDTNSSDPADQAPNPTARWGLPENGVYRAWYEMATRIEVPEWHTWTPRELAAAGVEQGLNREAVERLTLQFENIRYGREKLTSEHELRAEELRDQIDDARQGESNP